MSAGRKINTKSQSWGTPPKYITPIKSFFNGKIDLDPCSNEYSLVAANTEYSLPNKDGLLESWNYQKIFVNPPYGIDKTRKTRIKDWFKKCYNAHVSYDSEIIALVPVATNTSHWKEFVFGKASSICFLYDTRLKFLENGIESKKGAPMACCLIYWGDRNDEFNKEFSKFGAVVGLD